MASRINIGPEDGPYVAINESSGNLQLEDNSGNVVAEWDEGNAQWDFANNTLANVDALNSNSVNTDSLPNTPTFDDGYQSDGETVSKVNNGVVYSGHSDFNGSYQSAINFAEANDYSAVLLAPQDEMEFESVTVSDNIHLFGSGPGLVNELGTAQFSDLTISSDNVSVKRVEVFNEINIDASEVLLSEVRCNGPVSVTDRRSIITNCRDLDVTLDSDFNVVAGNLATTVTDNGDGNEVGLNT